MADVPHRFSYQNLNEENQHEAYRQLPQDQYRRNHMMDNTINIATSAGGSTSGPNSVKDASTNANFSSKKQSAQKKRQLACVNCRYSKLKCQFSSVEEPKTCDRCRQQGIACKVEGRSEERQHLEDLSHRLSRVENSLEILIGKIDASLLVKPDLIGHSGAHPWHHSASADTSIHYNKRLSIPQSPTSSISTASSPVLKGNPAIWRKRDRKLGTKELLSEVNSAPSSPGINEYEESLRIKRSKPSPELPSRDLISRGLINASEADECLMFFSTNVSRYLPGLVLNYTVHFDSSVRQRSPLLFASVLAVSSLYHPNYQDRHKMFRREFKLLAEKIDRPRVEVWDLAKTNQHDIQPILDDIVALIISGAWLGGELGFRASLVASEMFGYLIPANPQNFKYTEPTRSILGGIGLVTYIIEKRLRIIHDIPSRLPADAPCNRRDLYLPIFLSSLSGGIKSAEIDPSELKATANVELSALMTMYQQELSEKLEATVMAHWNTQLDKWLCEWMGKLTVHLGPSAWKPVMLTFYYAKLFLNFRVIQDSSIEAIHSNLQNDELKDSEFIHCVRFAETAALSILQMLVFDEDIQRLVRVGPVFYPPIFVTASAFLLKLLCVGPNIQYKTNDESLITIITRAMERLEESISSELLPCYVTIQNLDDALNKVVKTLQQAGRYPLKDSLSLSTSPNSSRSNSQDQSSMIEALSLGPFQSVHRDQSDDSRVLPINNYKWSFSPANAQSFVPATILPMPIPPQGQPRLVPEGMIPLLHPQPVLPPPTPPAPTHWPLSAEGFRQVYDSHSEFLMDAHSTNIIHSLFDLDVMTE